MPNKACPSHSGETAWMNAAITQDFDIINELPQIIDWTCPYCGYTETETIPLPGTLGIFNSGVGRLMDSIPPGNSWGIYDNGVGHKPVPVPDPLKP